MLSAACIDSGPAAGPRAWEERLEIAMLDPQRSLTDSQISQRARCADAQPISALMAQALAQPDLVSLAAGFVDQTSLPADEVRQALAHLLSNTARAAAALQYGTTAGYMPLRAAVLEDLVQADRAAGGGCKASVEQVVVTAGSNQLLHLVAEALFDPGDIVLTTAPSYFVYLGLLRSLSVRSVGIDCDDEGMIPEALDEALARLAAAGDLPRVRAIYVVSYFDNPRGISLALKRRAAIVELARRWSRRHVIRVIDDSAYRELRYDGPDLPSLKSFDEGGETVIVAQTFSKSFSPGIRIGWGILPPDLVEPVLNLKGNIDFGSPNFSQHLMASVLELGLHAPHVARLRAAYQRKRAALLEAADEYLGPISGVTWVRPAGGLYVWLTLPPHVQSGPGGRLFDAAVAEGVLYVPGEYSYASEGTGAARNTIRLSFGVPTEENIRIGVQALSRALRRVME